MSKTGRESNYRGDGFDNDWCDYDCGHCEDYSCRVNPLYDSDGDELTSDAEREGEESAENED